MCSYKQYQDLTTYHRVKFILLTPVYTTGFADHSSSFSAMQLSQRSLSNLSMQPQGHT